MVAKKTLKRCLNRAQEVLDKAVADLTREDIAYRAGPETNPISFILWHMSRVEDRLINHTLRQDSQIWEEGAWHSRLGFPKELGLPDELKTIGFNFTEEQVAAFPVPDLTDLLRYQRAVREATISFIDSLDDSEFERPFRHGQEGDTTLAFLIGRTIVHVSQHAGQIDFIKGLIRSRRNF